MRTNRSTHRHARSALAAVVATVAAGLAMWTFAAPASHAEDLSQYPGYTDLRDVSVYYTGSWTVLHLDTEHQTDAGFWFAIADDNSYMSTWTPVPVRNMRWVYQPWGVWCDSPDKVVGWNKWVDGGKGGYRCLPDVAALTAEHPDYPQRVSACQASTGHDYEDAVPYVKDDGTTGWECDDWEIDDTKIGDSNGLMAATDTQSSCAPWEKQTGDGYGNKECFHQFYSWLNDPRYPNGGEATQATGITKKVTETAHVTKRATATVTRAVTVTVTRGHQTVHVHGKVHGKQITVTATAPVLVPGTARARGTARASATLAITRTATCTKDTAEAASTCAEELASATANAAAGRAAQQAAQARADAAASRNATKSATFIARQNAKQETVTAVAIRKAKRQAGARARAKMLALTR